MIQRIFGGLAWATLSLFIIAATIWLVVWFESGLSG